MGNEQPWDRSVLWKECIKAAEGEESGIEADRADWREGQERSGEAQRK